MQSNNKILELAEKLPFGAKKEVAERTGLCITTVCNILKGNKCRLNNLKKVTQVAKEILKECDNDPRHTEDLILSDLKSFKDITDFINGEPKRFAGFNILEFTRNPTYNANTLEKVPFGNEKAETDTFCSFAFSGYEVMRADGEMHMYERINDPELRGTIVGFDKRFIALPIRNKAIGAIVSAKV